MLLSGTTDTSAESGAAEAAVMKSALAPTAREIAKVFMAFSPGVIVSGCQWTRRPMVPGTDPLMPSIGRCERICRSIDLREAAAIKRFRVLSHPGYRDGLSVRLGTPIDPLRQGSYFFGACHASVTALSMM